MTLNNFVFLYTKLTERLASISLFPEFSHVCLILCGNIGNCLYKTW